MKEFHPNLKRGDAFLHNSPYHGGSHAADHTILVPVIDDAGTHHFTVVAKAHQADCGNSVPTTYMGEARDVYHEGALIFPAVKVQQDYRNIDDVIRMCRMRIRVPDQWWGDFLAMVGAARIGERELLALAGEVGWDALHEYEKDFFDYSEQRMVASIRKTASGHATRVSTHDPFPGTPTSGVPIKAKVEIRPDDAIIEIDLRENPDCLPCGLNLSEACARTAAMVGVFDSLDQCHREERGLVSAAQDSPARRLYCWHPSSPNLVLGCDFQRRRPRLQRGAERDRRHCRGDRHGRVRRGDSGVDECDLRHRPQDQTAVRQPGSAWLYCRRRAPATDAWQTIMHVGCAGMCFMDSIELDELRHPIYVYERRFVIDTEGPGRHRGAHSLLVDSVPPAATSTRAGKNTPTDGTINRAKGVRGGHDGSAARQYKVGRNGQVDVLPSCAQVRVLDGERIRTFSSGGAGYGSPLQRDPASVARDIKDRWIGAERARTVYGVILDASGNVDVKETRRLRAAMTS